MGIEVKRNLKQVKPYCKPSIPYHFPTQNKQYKQARIKIYLQKHILIALLSQYLRIFYIFEMSISLKYLNIIN
jgi:hypothetical protein